MKFLDYHVAITRDEQTGQVVATIPALGIADYGPDLSGALTSLDEMLKFIWSVFARKVRAFPKSAAQKKAST